MGEKYDDAVAVLVGAGIGVTPFAAILKNIWSVPLPSSVFPSPPLADPSPTTHAGTSSSRTVSALFVVCTSSGSARTRVVWGGSTRS